MIRKEWLEASTVMLMALQKKPYTSPYNYKILTLKRSGKSSFMPSGYVFPGGTIEPVDSNPAWKEFFKTSGVSDSALHKLLLDPSKLSVMFHDQNKSNFPKQLSLRVAAIREAFEESGVLLCRNNACEGPVMWGESINLPELSEWRTKVQKDANNFLEMCQKLKVIPDIWSLKLWSNWLTPPDIKKRFDTSFYTVCLPCQPETCADGNEIEKLAWHSPIDILNSNARKNLWLPPPQQYEISRILPFCMLEDLARFAHEREPNGIERFGGHTRLKTKDGVIFILPGDELSEESDIDKYAEITSRELRNGNKRVHRLEITKDEHGERCKVAASNVQPSFGHILPYTENSPG